MAAAKFEVDASVRFIGTDTRYAVTKCHKRKLEYQIKRAADGADIQWVEGIYLELAGAYCGHERRQEILPEMQSVDYGASGRNFPDER
jgi:hypothetical protein